MESNVLAEVEIEDTKIVYYTSIILRQKFNEHHSFAIRINHDVLETQKSFSLTKAQKLIGKSVIIRLIQVAVSAEVAYEFRGIICEISMEQSNSFSGDLILKGYSPTILLENGAHLTSFYKKNLKQIVEQVTKSVADNNCTVNVNNRFKKVITYISQYRESNFHFLNRLSADFNEPCYYNGTDLFFGKPSAAKNIDITYGEDVNSIQLTLRILPMSFTSYSYNSKEDKIFNAKAPDQVDGLNEYTSYVLKESNKVFSEPVNGPLRQRAESKSDLEEFVKKQKAAIAADLEVLTGTSDNPAINIGAIANVKISKLEDGAYKKEDYGKFLVTGIEHHVGDNGKYYNTFEALPAGVEAIPVKNVIAPVAEPQIATVKDNKDPDNMGRIRVQMLWQKDNEMTDWLRVMTPDAGGGKGGAKNRGLVVVPEPGDQVLICFRYDNPDRPFVMGSLFHGKTGGGGGSGNNTKSLTSKSGHTVTLNDGGGITIKDKTALNHIEVDGTDKVTITGDGTIALVSKGNNITITSKDNNIQISSAATIRISSATTISIKSKIINIGEGTDTINVKAGTINIEASSNNINGTNHIYGGDTKIDGGNVFIN